MTDAACEEVPTVNEALDCPAATVTDPGTVAALILLERAIVRPPAPAGPVRVTTPVEEVPPVTVEGVRVKLLREAGVMVKVEVTGVPFNVAVIVEVV